MAGVKSDVQAALAELGNPEPTTKLVATVDVINKGQRVPAGEEFEVPESSADSLVEEGLAAKPGSKDAKEAKKQADD